MIDNLLKINGKKHVTHCEWNSFAQKILAIYDCK